MIVAWPGKEGITTPDKDKWLECDGTTFLATKYPELYKVLGTNIKPNLNGQFLRGTTLTSQTLTSYNDTIKSHDSFIAPHTHRHTLIFTLVCLRHSQVIAELF